MGRSGGSKAEDAVAGAGAETEKPGPPVPRALGQTVVAPGRVLGWAEFGHPDGDPLLWFHGTPGARTQIPPAVDEVALQRGFRIISVERPGTGVSTDHRYDRVVDYAADIEALADELGLERFGVVGLSGGGPYTLAVAHEMPDQVVVACLLGGIGPTRGPDAVWSYTRLLRFFAPATEVLRTPLGAALARVVAVAENFGEQALQLFARVVGGSDREILTEPHFSAMFINDMVNAGELRAVAHDIALFCRHWGFLLADVEPPVIVWQGLADSIVPQSHGHHQAARLPDAQLRVRPGEGHFAGFSDVVAVLDSIRQVWAAETAEPVLAGTAPKPRTTTNAKPRSAAKPRAAAKPARKTVPKAAPKRAPKSAPKASDDDSGD